MDSLREVKQARALDIPIVSPVWLSECLHSGSKLSEKLFPPTFDPSRNIGDLAPMVSSGECMHQTDDRSCQGKSTSR